MLEAIFFVTAIICLLAAILTVSAHNSVHALLYLVTMMIAMALLLFLLGSPFAAALQIIIYAGAVMVLFVFITMMLHQGNRSLAAEKKLFSINVAIGPLLLAGLVLLELLFITLQPSPRAITASSALVTIEAPPPENKQNISAIRLSIQGHLPHGVTEETLTIEYTVMEKIVTVGPLTLAEHAGPIRRVDDIDSVKALAELLYGPYHTLVIIAAMLLLSALISAVMITKQKRPPKADKGDMALASGLDSTDGLNDDSSQRSQGRTEAGNRKSVNGLTGATNTTWEKKRL